MAALAAGSGGHLATRRLTNGHRRDEIRLADITEQTAQALIRGSGSASAPGTGS